MTLGLFQSDHDLDIVGDRGHEAGLTRLEEDKEIEHIYYSFHGNICSAPDLVRDHLNSGVLVKLIAEKEATLLAMPTKDRELEFGLQDPCYVYVLLVSCAMTLGLYTEGGLMPDALKQMKKALFGPDGYVNGAPYDFESKGLLETANSAGREDKKPNQFGFIGMNVIGPGGLFNTGMSDFSTSAIIKELRQKYNNPDSCAGCGVDSTPGGKNLLVCSKCRDRKYCSVAYQKKAWKFHKKVCEPAVE
ncbi:hypothetical protein CC86DRAFT_393760 [Ophiobolus disseminans]|uniref:MYND-type domain-containing protein n=1 Tax=Ophiobolus disseminans TaxID=1469910 RepID=A0A6A7A521_9PLEO|nr:hypothetical protein CC86DRAFT_393760 [Ophiobolus disseminans]